MKGALKYLFNKATAFEIHHHLSSCDVKFAQALSERANIKDYSKKIFCKAERFEAWAEGVLVGLVAVYCNDPTKCMAYITSVSVVSDWQGKGIAAHLIHQCIEHAKSMGMHFVSLEVERGNVPAIRLYEKCGFVENDNGDSYITMNFFLTRGKHAK